MTEEVDLTVTEVVDHEAVISDLKKKLGDQGNEIGQLRKIACGCVNAVYSCVVEWLIKTWLWEACQQGPNLTHSVGHSRRKFLCRYIRKWGIEWSFVDRPFAVPHARKAKLNVLFTLRKGL